MRLCLLLRVSLTLHEQFVFQAMLQELSDMDLVFLNRSKYENIIKIHQTKSQIKSQQTLFSNNWKTAGAFVKPKGITSYSKCLRCVLKAVFHSSPSHILSRWQVLWRSSLVKMMASCNSLKEEVSNGKMYLFLTVILFDAR